MQQAAARRVDKVREPEGSDADGGRADRAGSGNLGLVYVPGPERLLLEEIEARWPALVPGLVAHPGIGVRLRPGRATGRWRSARRRRDLATGVVEGVDPLRAFGAHAARDAADGAPMARAPELYVNSSSTPTRSRWRRSSPWSAATVASVGGRTADSCWHPPHLLAHLEPIMGGEELHRQLVGILESLGHRTELQRSTP